MCICARTVALWLAACALAASAQEGSAPVCAPQSPNCTYLRTGRNHEYGSDDYVYSVHGQDLDIYITDGVLYQTDCTAVKLDDPSWPRLPKNVKFVDVRLRGCPPPTGKSYVSALQALNVSIITKLSSWDIPTNANLTSTSFAGLPASLKELDLSANAGVLMMEPGALAGLNEVRTIRLLRISVDRLPIQLDDVTIRESNVEELPKGAMNVPSVWIQENLLTTINATVPRLQNAQLATPALKSIALYDTAPALLRDELFGACRSLQTLELRRSRALTIPADLLRGVEKLKKFSFTDSNVTELPSTLFNHTQRLEFVDLSRNKLAVLPSELFFWLPDLRVLWLANNRLTASNLRVLAPLTMLTTLDLSRNHLGDLCPDAGEPSDLSSLQQLQNLSLIHSRIPRFCPAWLKELHQLKHLDLSDNDIHTVSCADFQVQSRSNTNGTTVDVRDNPLEQFECSEDDNESDEDEVMEFKQINLLKNSDAICQCSCPSVWQCAPKTDMESTTPATSEDDDSSNRFNQHYDDEGVQKTIEYLVEIGRLPKGKSGYYVLVI